MKVLLINPFFKKNYIHNARWDGTTISGSQWPPIFLAQCCGLLEKHGHKCKLIDAETNCIPNEIVFERHCCFYDFYDSRYMGDEPEPDYVVIYISEEGIEKNMELAKMFSNIDSKIIFVGPWVNVIEKRNSEYVDHYVLGEFEHTVLKIIEGKIENKVIVSNKMTQKEVDDLPWVTKTYFKHLNIRNYKIGSLYHPFVDMFVGRRRCYWGKCTFCLYPNTIFMKSSGPERKLDDVLDEIEFVSNRGKSPYCIKPSKVKEIFFQDGTVRPKRLKEVSEGIIKRGIDITWSTYARGDMLYSKDILRVCKESGLHVLHVGYESGSNKILKEMKKGVTKKQLERFTGWCKELDIDIHGDFLFGTSEYETEETIKETIKWAKGLNLELYQFSVPRVYKGTPFYKYLKENNYLDSRGRVSYPHLKFEDLENWCKIALKECMLNFNYIKKMVTRPREVLRLIRFSKPFFYYLITNQKQVG